MIWWTIFPAMVALYILAIRLFVPVEHRRNYWRCRKTWDHRLSGWLLDSIWGVAAVQGIVAPDPFSVWLKTTGAAVWIIGEVLVIWAWRVNDMFVPALIYVPPSWRVKRGPYRFMEHPGYAGFILSAIGIACLLGGWWTIFPLAAYIALIVRRMGAEDRLLSGKISL